MTDSSLPYAVCRLAVVPVRRFPDMISEMSSQVRFGEGVEILEENRKLWKVRLRHDGYEGWVDSRQFTPPQATCPPRASVLTDELAGWATCAGERRLLPPGTPLPEFSDGKFLVGVDTWEWTGAVHRIPQKPDFDLLLKEAERYLATPYLWGGRTLWGIDCSGLTQTLLRHQGVTVRRDCVEQVEQGRPVSSLAEALPGDLAFFDGARDGGSHVGIILTAGQVLHSSGYVRIDDLSAYGITVRKTGQLSHRLTFIRRVTDW